MLRALDQYIHHKVYSQQVVDIAVLAAAKILRVNMCIYCNQDKRAILYVQPCVPPSSRDVYLQYSNEHYNAICSKHSVECFNENASWNITPYDIDHFAKIGAFFNVADPMDPSVGGQLFFVPPPNFGEMEVPIIGNVNSAPLTPDARNKSVLPSGVNNQRKPAVKNPIVLPVTEDNGTIFGPNYVTLDNSVLDFNQDTEIYDQYPPEVSVVSEEENVSDMFADMDLTQTVPDKYQFKDNNSTDEDAVLDNSEGEVENVTPLKMSKKTNQQHPGTNIIHAHIDLTRSENNLDGTNTMDTINLTTETTQKRSAAQELTQKKKIVVLQRVNLPQMSTVIVHL